MKSVRIVLCAAVCVLLFCGPSTAHFGMIIPSDNMVMQDDNRTIDLKISFSHPFEMIGMPLVKPAAFYVFANGQKQMLNNVLTPVKVMGQDAWRADYKIKRPGAYLFAMEPAPYWEPAEDCFIVHYTKTVVAAFGDDEGWDTELGLKTEIVPLSKPFGLYSGNVFQGIVKKDGVPVPFVEIEVEHYNRHKNVVAPTDYMIAQTIKADSNGMFTYAVPASGWWGFAALSISDEKIVHDGEKKDIEIGAVIWVKFEEWTRK